MYKSCEKQIFSQWKKGKWKLTCIKANREGGGRKKKKKKETNKNDKLKNSVMHIYFCSGGGKG